MNYSIEWNLFQRRFKLVSHVLVQKRSVSIMMIVTGALLTMVEKINYLIANGKRGFDMVKHNKLRGKKLLLMGSKAFQSNRLPIQITKRINEALTMKMRVIVGEAPGSCRLFQDYLKYKNYTKVIVGHAKSIRYNVGKWKTKQYGIDVMEREKNMIEECNSAIIIWTDQSGVIAENLEFLKRLGKPTFLYEYSNKTKVGKAGWLDLKRIYDPYYFWKEFQRKKKRLSKK